MARPGEITKTYDLSCHYKVMREDVAALASKHILAETLEAAWREVAKEVNAGSFVGVSHDLGGVVVVPRERIFHIVVEELF
jgi:hypothetical protein